MLTIIVKVLIAPLNWGLGHASRSIDLIYRHLHDGDEVVLAGDGASLTLLRNHFPTLRYYPLAPLDLHYSEGRSQVWAMMKALPALLRFSVVDYCLLQSILEREPFDLVISDNRFGLHSRRTRCVYITHQLLIRMPAGLRWLQPLAHLLHKRIIRRFDECWIPDDERQLSGELGHHYRLPRNARFIGPLSRFHHVSQDEASEKTYDTVAVISGPEPQRSLLEKQLLDEYATRRESLLLVRGLVNQPTTAMQRGNITLVPHLPDSQLAYVLCHAHTIISRSGYSSIMDYDALGLIERYHSGDIDLRLIPTPGQPEQEYLARLHTR